MNVSAGARVRAALTTIALTLCLGAAVPALSQVSGISCPAQIDANDCVANDLQPTGAEVINGPAFCNAGEIFAATVRVHFANGGGANTRFNVGFYVGEAGASAIGGASCSFDSLQPISATPNPLGGPYAELNGDSCGDITRSDPTYKDIQLAQVACADEDGDGNVDLSYVLTWENNGNQANCANPLDPAEFEPRPPKCLSDLDYNLPIVVENPASIEVVKGANPRALYAPGGVVRFPITIVNTSPEASDPVTINSIVDQVQGEPAQDISGQTDCTLPFTLAAGESRTCIFTSQVTGSGGETITDTVTVTGADDEGQSVQGMDSATVTVLPAFAPTPPGELELAKFALPASIDEPGGTATYLVLVRNPSQRSVTLTSLVDDLYGDLNGRGSCSVPQTLSGENTIYFCAFQEQVTGQPGDQVTDVILARGTDGANQLQTSDSATVLINDLASAIAVAKTANPVSVPEPSGSVTYTLQIQNISAVDAVTINALVDSRVAGTPAGCALPVSLAPGEVYSCSYTNVVSGNSGDAVTNVVTASGMDDDGVQVSDSDAATVFITGQSAAIEVAKIAIPRELPLAGGSVRYLVAIRNISTASDPVTITSLTDAVDGAAAVSLDGEGSCDLTNLVLQPGGPGSVYLCSFTQVLPPAAAGTQVRDVVTATGFDDDGSPVEGTAEATVSYVAAPAPDPQLTLRKIAAPIELPEPGGDVTFTVLIANTTDPSIPNSDLDLTTLADSIYGDLFTRGDCSALQNATLPPASSISDVISCSFSATVNGDPGDTETNTITATALDAGNQPVQASDDATVTITDLLPSIGVTKTASPTSVDEPGGNVNFTIEVENASQFEPLTLTSLVDSVHGDLLVNGLCPPPPTLPPGGPAYRCSFTAFVGGEPGFEERNTVTAQAEDDDGNVAEGNDQATVTVKDTQPTIAVLKLASPDRIPAAGGQVTFSFTTTNTSTTDDITLESLDDSVFGDLNGQGNCSVPRTLAPGESYTCEFSTTLSGAAGETHLDTVTARGRSDDGDPVSAAAVAIVSFVAAIQQVPALGQLGLGLLAILTGLCGWQRLRRRQSS